MSRLRTSAWAGPGQEQGQEQKKITTYVLPIESFTSLLFNTAICNLPGAVLYFLFPNEVEMCETRHTHNS